MTHFFLSVPTKRSMASRIPPPQSSRSAVLRDPSISDKQVSGRPHGLRPVPSKGSMQPLAEVPPVLRTQERVDLECSPVVCVRACGVGFFFLLALISIASLGMIAGASLWLGSTLKDIRDGNKLITLNPCTNNALYTANFNPCP